MIFRRLTLSHSHLVLNHVESIISYINFKRRQKEYETCCQLYEEAIAKAKSPYSVAFLSIHYARFMEKVITKLKECKYKYNIWKYTNFLLSKHILTLILSLIERLIDWMFLIDM
jgi:hypothetical protein